MNVKRSLILLLCLIAMGLTTISAEPCDIKSGSMKSNHIEFDENTSANSLLFTLPFVGNTTSDQIELSFRSHELNASQMNKYFELVGTNFMLKSSYDLDEIRIDLIELVFICTVGVPSTSNDGTSGLKTDNQRPRSNRFLLYITINDVNNKVPEFIGEPYTLSLQELTAIGTVIFRDIKAIDRDLPNKPNSQIAFSIEEGPCSNYFEFPLTTRSDLAVRQLIEYERLQHCNLTIRVHDHGLPQLSSTSTIQITIIDIDNKDPIFTQNMYIGYINRNSKPGSLVNMTSVIHAYDQDTGINMELNYQLTSNPKDLFAIDELTGAIKLQNVITDYDKRDYNVIVKASQRDNPLKSALTMTKIEIVEVNDYPPKFEKALYEADVMENADIGTYVTQIHATDVDKNRLEYSIINSHESPFMIDKFEGILRVNGRLDYEMKREYVLTVSVSDGNFTASALAKVTLTNMVDKAPQFEFNNYSFKLKIPYDVYIGQVRANDIERTKKLLYSIKLLDEADSNLFCISQNGIVYICPSGSEEDMKRTNQTSLFNLSDEELRAKFTKSEYKFNVSASIYSPDLMTNLNSHVECRIEVEDTQLATASSNKDTVQGYRLKAGDTSTIRPGSLTRFFDEEFFRDPKFVYIVIAVIVASIFLLALCACASVWLRCSRHRKHSKDNKNNNSNFNETTGHQGFKFFPTFGLFDSAAIENNRKKLKQMNHDFSCSCSSGRSDNSCKNSTSGISCLSESSAVFHSSSSSGRSSNRGNKSLQKSTDPSDDIYLKSSTVPTISDYFSTNEVKVMKSTKLIGHNMEHLKHLPSAYADHLCSQASSIKNSESPILLVRQEAESSFFENFQIAPPIDYFQLENKKESKTLRENSTFKLIYENVPNSKINNSRSKTLNHKKQLQQQQQQFSSGVDTSMSFSALTSSSSCASSPGQQRVKSPVLMSFQPPPPQQQQQLSSSSSTSNNAPISYSSLESETVDEVAPSVVFNYHEPLSANSETKFEDELLLRNLSKIEPIGNDDTTDETSRSFRDHLDTCNDSLAKLVNIFNHKSKTSGTSEMTSSYTVDDKSFEVMPSDRSLISANVDRFTDCEKDSRSTVTVSSSFGSFMTNITRLSEPLADRVRSLVQSSDSMITSGSSSGSAYKVFENSEYPISKNVGEDAGCRNESRGSPLNLGNPLRFIRVNSFIGRRPNSVEPIQNETYV